jgi:hypothetical protein
MIKKLLVMIAALTLLVMSVNTALALTFTDDFTSDPFPAWHKNGFPANFTWDGVSSVTGIGRSYQNITGFDQLSDYTIDLNVTYSAFNQQVSVALGKFGVNDNYELLFNLGNNFSQIKCIGTICKLNGTLGSVGYFNAIGTGTHLMRAQQSGNNVLMYADGVLLGNITIQYFNTTYEGLGLWVHQVGESVDSITLNQGGCVPNWVASTWSSCTLMGNDYNQTKTYTDVNVCNMPETKPDDVTRNCGKSNNHYGLTTDFEQVADPSNVPNAIYDTPSGRIAWVNPIDIRGVDFEQAIIATEDLVFVNKSLISASMDSVADVSFKLKDWEKKKDQCSKNFHVYYSSQAYSDIKKLEKAYGEGKAIKVADKSRIGLDCYDDTICKQVTCANSIVGFQAQHFSGFGVGNYSATYETADYLPIVADGLGTAGATLVSFMAIIVIGALGIWGYKQYKKVK